jgi:hypothetical protein
MLSVIVYSHTGATVALALPNRVACRQSLSQAPKRLRTSYIDVGVTRKLAQISFREDKDLTGKRSKEQMQVTLSAPLFSAVGVQAKGQYDY